MIIRGLSFDPDGGVAMEYVNPANDIKASGVMQNHTIFIPGGDRSEYLDEITALQDAAMYLLRDVLDDLPHLPVATERPAEDDDEDEDDE